MLKQKLLATTALVSLFAGSAFADGAQAPMMNDMSVKIGGNFDGHAITEKSDVRRNDMTKNNQDIGFSTDAEVWLEAKSSTAKGLEYGAHVGISTHANSYKNASKGSDRSYLWLDHADLGRMEFGSNNDASEAMRIGADSVAVGTGGISGAWVQVLSPNMFSATTTVGLDNFIISPWNIGDNYMDLDFDANTAVASAQVWNVEKSRKVNYYTPKMNGFQLGFSYTPDTENKGNGVGGVVANASLPNTTTNGSNGNAANKNLISAGITWDGKVMNDVMGKFSIVGAYAGTQDNANSTTSKDLEGVDFGAQLHYKDFVAAASYGFLGQTGFQSAATGVADSYYVTAGLSHKMDKLKTSFSYLFGHKNHNKSNIFSVGTEYSLASGIMPYAEATYYNLHLKNQGGLALSGAYNNVNVAADIAAASTSSTNAGHAEGTVFVLGTKLSF